MIRDTVHNIKVFQTGEFQCPQLIHEWQVSFGRDTNLDLNKKTTREAAAASKHWPRGHKLKRTESTKNFLRRRLQSSDTLTLLVKIFWEKTGDTP